MTETRSGASVRDFTAHADEVFTMSYHLTLTGIYAGTTFCGIAPYDRDEGDEFAHLPYAQPDEVRAFVETHVTCEKCRKVYLEIYGA